MPLHHFLSRIESDVLVRKNSVDYKNSNQSSNSGMRMEAICAAAMVVASHSCGVQGANIETFLGNLVYELCDWNCDESHIPKISFPLPVARIVPRSRVKYFRDLVVPFLGPPNQSWPKFSNLVIDRSQINLDNLIRTKNGSEMDFKIESFPLTGESKDWKTPLPAFEVAKICIKIPRTSLVHLVFVQVMQKSYFNKESLGIYLTQEEASEDQKTFLLKDCLFYKVEIPSNSALTRNCLLKTITGFPVVPKNSTRKCLVLFVELGKNIKPFSLATDAEAKDILSKRQKTDMQ